MTEKTERIVLPRSGLVLMRGQQMGDGGASYGLVYGVHLIVRPNGYASAWVFCEPLEDAPVDVTIEATDARVLSLRSALLAGAEETVAQELYRDWAGDHAVPFSDVHPPFRESFLRTARAVLAALCREASK